MYALPLTIWKHPKDLTHGTGLAKEMALDPTSGHQLACHSSISSVKKD